jgi:hypothetical protein
VTGVFSMDGGANAAAYSGDAGSWGAIKAKPNGHLGLSGQGIDGSGNELGLENDIYFSGGELETADCSETLPMAECGGNQRVLKFWQWGPAGDFALTRTAGLPR